MSRAKWGPNGTPPREEIPLAYDPSRASETEAAAVARAAAAAAGARRRWRRRRRRMSSRRGASRTPRRDSRDARTWVGFAPTSPSPRFGIFRARDGVGGRDGPPRRVRGEDLRQSRQGVCVCRIQDGGEASNAMALDGVAFGDAGDTLRVRRPNDYDAGRAVGLGPTAPRPDLNLAALGLGAPGRAGPATTRGEFTWAVYPLRRGGAPPRTREFVRGSARV